MPADTAAELGGTPESREKRADPQPAHGVRDAGGQVALTEVCVLTAVVRALRAHTDAQILVGDTTTGRGTTQELWAEVGYREALAGLDVRLVDIEDGPLVEVNVPGGGLVFR